MNPCSSGSREYWLRRWPAYYQVLDLRLDAELVVLSACVTGRGEGDGRRRVVNFARAFHQAGARSDW